MLLPDSELDHGMIRILSLLTGISRLQDLNKLALYIEGSAVQDLPDLTQFNELKDLTPDLGQTWFLVAPL